MRGARLLVAMVAALAAASCARQQQTYVIDPSTGQPVSMMAPSSYAPPQYAEPQAAPPQAYAEQTYQQPAPGGRGLFNSRGSTPQVYAQPQVQQQVQPSSVIQYNAPQYAASQTGGPYASASPYEQPYTLDSGDKLRVVVFGQDGISNTYLVDAGGNVNLPLVGVVSARGATAQQLSQRIAERLKQGYVREPHVTVEVETYRPFFILGEVTTPGQYPYVADMTVEKAVAIAGGFAPRASKDNVELTRNAPGQSFKSQVPLTYPLRPGDTVVVKERWF